MDRAPANIVLAYHGFVAQRADALTFREHVDDFKSQVAWLQSKGYAFVTPQQYLDWQQGVWVPTTPIALIIIDDGLDSISLVTSWLASEHIPYGLSIIARRQRLRLPEEGFASWAQLEGDVASGYATLINHTYNLHNLCLAMENGTLNSVPILEAPCWIDDGAVLYRAAGDTRYYWDFSLIDGATWGFPIFGSDPGTNFTTPITSTMTIDVPSAQTISTLRLFLALGSPPGAGYGAHVQIRIDGSLVADTTIQPKDYGTRTQWVEREFLSIPVTPTSLTAGSHTIEFQTLNTGAGLARVYAVPDFSGTFALTTTATSVVAGKVGPDYSDFPAGATWPARPGIILAAGTGRSATDTEYHDYVLADMTKENDAISRLLNATWTDHKNPYDETKTVLFGVVAYGTYADGTLADTQLRYRPDASFTAQTMRFKWVNQFGSRYAAIVNVQVGTSPSGPWTQLAQIAPNWNGFHWQEFALDTPYAFSAGTDYWIRLQTLNKSPYGEGLMRVYIDQRAPPRPIFFPVYRNWVLPDGYGFPGVYVTGPVPIPSTFAISQAGPDWYFVAKSDRSDVWPTSLDFSGSGDWSWGYADLNGDGVPFVDAWSEVDGASATPTQIAYPFGSFFNTGTGTAYVHQQEDINATLKTAFAAAGLDAGYTIWPNRNRVVGTPQEPDVRFTQWTMGRLLIYGDVDPQVTINNFEAYTGFLWPDVRHSGVQWQTSLESDPSGNATIKYSAQALDFIAFDANYFKTDGTIQRGRLNDGGTYTDVSGRSGSFSPGETVTGATSGASATIDWATNDAAHDVLKIASVIGAFVAGETITGATSLATASIVAPGPAAYADDKTYLQSRGVIATLILSNYSWVLDDVDPAIASFVVNNPAIFVTQIGDRCVADGWDGVTLNLESVPAADRAAATDFITQLSQDLHGRGKLLHITAPGPTGTSYDDPTWVGWCDHGELIRQVDAMKVMTYTESGPFSGPAPHAPDWFFTAVYDHLDTLIDLPFRPRLLVGCNAFGHEWQTGVSGATYVSYHTALADAYFVAAMITSQDHEGTWAKDKTTAWFGTPQTIQRAIDTALAHGYGGIGVWKADDGDITEQWPQYPTIGRADPDPAYREAQLDDSLLLGATGGPEHQTQIRTVDSGREARSAAGVARVRYQLAPQALNDLQRARLIELFRSHRGRSLAFRARDPQDWQLQGESIGTGDGVRRAWPVTKTYSDGLASLTRSITLLRPGTVTVYIAGVATTAVIDHTAGWVSFASPPAAGAAVTVDAQFDLRARFDLDALRLSFEAWSEAAAYHQLQATPIREVAA